MIEKEKLDNFCRKYNISRLSLFGSYSKKTNKEDSDMDILVEFKTGHTPGYLGLSKIESELSQMLNGRKIDLKTSAELSKYFRDEVVSSAVVQYED